MPLLIPCGCVPQMAWCLQEGRWGVDNNVPHWVVDIAPSGVPDELGRGEEAAVANAHYPHLLPFPVLVQEPLDPLPVGTVPPCRHARHLVHRSPHFAHPAMTPTYLLQGVLVGQRSAGGVVGQ